MTKDHYRCSACDIDYGTIDAFDKHRKTWHINSKGDLAGYCTPPGSLHLTEWNGTWWTPEGLDRAQRMSDVGKRGKSGEAS